MQTLHTPCRYKSLCARSSRDPYQRKGFLEYRKQVQALREGIAIRGAECSGLEKKGRCNLAGSKKQAMRNCNTLQVNGLFGGLFGGNGRKAQDDGPQEINFHDDEPPFPNELLEGTYLYGRELRSCYKASVDGFGAADFHRCTDFTGPCIIVGITSTGLLFGGFNPEGFRSTDDYADSFEAFLFVWQNVTDKSLESESENLDGRVQQIMAKCRGQMPEILKKIGGSGAAVFDYARGGPQFGSDGLIIGPPMTPVMGGFAGPDSNSGFGDLATARSRLGLSYALREDGKNSVFGDINSAKLVEVFAFCCPKLAALYR